MQVWNLPRTQSTLCFKSSWNSISQFASLSHFWRLHRYLIERQSCMPKEVHFVSDANLQHFTVLSVLPISFLCRICITLYRTFMQHHGGLSCSMAIRGYRCQFLSSHANFQRTKTNYSFILKLSSGTSSSFSMPFSLFPSFLFWYSIFIPLELFLTQALSPRICF